jgi:hypothetical protein
MELPPQESKYDVGDQEYLKHKRVIPMVGYDKVVKGTALCAINKFSL